MIRFLKRFFRIPPRQIEFYGRTDTGKVRPHNEDSFCILRTRRIFIVADGMGGHNAGEVASKLAIEALIDFFSEDRVQSLRGRDIEIQYSMIDGFKYANKVVMEKAASDPQFKGMGCTLVMCLLDDNMLHTCHVGDARCYVMTRQKLEQITTDHTGVTYNHGAQADAKSEETVNIKPRNVVTRAIGFPFPQDPEYHCNPLSPGSKFLLCSDGLWSMVNDEKLQDILLDAPDPEQASEDMVCQANDFGGRDNITALVVYY